MTLNGWIQIAIYFAVLTALVVPLGRYMARVFEGERTFLSPVLRPVERGLYRLAGVDETREQHWITYTVAMLLFNAAGFLLLYALLRLQGLLPLNPAGMSAVAPDLTFNTAVSFATNTNWQNYGGESTLSYLDADGGPHHPEFRLGRDRHRACRRADPRLRAGLGQDGRQFLGRSHPLHALRAAAVCPSSPRLFSSGRACRRISAPMSTPPRSKAPSRPSARARPPRRSPSSSSAPMAAASGTPTRRVPYENPTPLSNFLEVLYILLISAALTHTFGRMVKDERQGWALYAAMSRHLPRLASRSPTGPKAAGNPHFAALGLDPANMEGKEVRFGIANSSLWAVATTAASNGSVNAMHDSFTPLGGMMALIMMQLGEIIYGGVGSGLYGMLLIVDRRHVRGRADGRPHAGISRQEDRGEGSQDGDARPS